MAEEQPVVADLPTGEPVPSQTPIPPPKPKSKPSKPSIGALLAAVPSNADAFLVHLQRCMSTPSGIDAVLMFTGYTARFSAEVLDTASRLALNHSAQRLIALAFALPPKTTILLSSVPSANPLATLALKLSVRLRAFAVTLSEGRMFMRTWALLALYFWGRRLVLSLLSSSSSSSEKKGATAADRSAETLDNTISWIQFVALTIYQSCENISFFGSKSVLPLSPAQQAKTARFGVRFWAFYVGTELGRLLIEYRRKQSGDVTSEEHKTWKQTWQQTFTRNLAWAPLTVHWSLEKGLGLNDLATWSIAYIPALIAGRNVWRDNA